MVTNHILFVCREPWTSRCPHGDRPSRGWPLLHWILQHALHRQRRAWNALLGGHVQDPKHCREALPQSHPKLRAAAGTHRQFPGPRFIRSIECQHSYLLLPSRSQMYKITHLYTNVGVTDGLFNKCKCVRSTLFLSVQHPGPRSGLRTTITHSNSKDVVK